MKAAHTVLGAPTGKERTDHARQTVHYPEEDVAGSWELPEAPSSSFQNSASLRRLTRMPFEYRRGWACARPLTLCRGLCYYPRHMKKNARKKTGPRENVFVTGAAGFIGRSLVRQLVEKGYRVTALDNFRFSNRDQVLNSPHIKWEEGDVRDYKKVSELVSRADHIIHLAAPSSFIMYEENDIESCDFTMRGFKTILEAMRKHGKRKIVWASTSAVYEEWGKKPRVPFHEGLEINPPDSKAGSKHWCELEARRYSNRWGFKCIAFRPFSVYGVGEHTKLGYANVTSLLTWALMGGQRPVIWGDGKQTRDFIYVDDVARAFIMAMEKNIPTCELNLGFGKEHSFNDVLDIVAKQLEVKAKPVHVDVPIQIYAYRLLADMKKAKKMLGFTPKVTLEEGISKIIKATRELPPGTFEKMQLALQQTYFKKVKFATKRG